MKRNNNDHISMNDLMTCPLATAEKFNRRVVVFSLNTWRRVTGPVEMVPKQDTDIWSLMSR